MWHNSRVHLCQAGHPGHHATSWSVSKVRLWPRGKVPRGSQRALHQVSHCLHILVNVYLLFSSSSPSFHWHFQCLPHSTSVFASCCMSKSYQSCFFHFFFDLTDHGTSRSLYINSIIGVTYLIKSTVVVIYSNWDLKLNCDNKKPLHEDFKTNLLVEASVWHVELLTPGSVSSRLLMMRIFPEMLFTVTVPIMF